MPAALTATPSGSLSVRWRKIKIVSDQNTSEKFGLPQKENLPDIIMSWIIDLPISFLHCLFPHFKNWKNTLFVTNYLLFHQSSSSAALNHNNIFLFTRMVKPNTKCTLLPWQGSPISLSAKDLAACSFICSDCPLRFEEHAGRCYQVGTDTLTAEAAQVACMTVGANLVTINNDAENEYIKGKLK